MSEPPAPERSRALRGEPYTESELREEPGFVDGVRFLYRRRVRLAVWFIAFCGIGIAALLVSYLTSPTTVQGVVALSFSGIERHEYPSGRKFTVEAFRGPDVLTKALSDAGIPQHTVSVGRLSAGIIVTPIIPGDVRARWMKQEKDGVRKDEYFPNEFRINLHVDELSIPQQVRLFDAIVKNYQGRVKYEQKSALSFLATGWRTSYEKLAAAYDFWDIPTLFAETYKVLDLELKSLITETLQSRDMKYQLGFRDIARELHNWRMIRLGALEAWTYQGRLVKNRDLTIQRMQYRLDDIDIRIRQKTHEANEALRLLGFIDRPNSLIAGRLSNEKGLPVVDLSALERLLKNDYVAPVVTKISTLQSEAQELEADKSRLQRHLAVLPKASNVDVRQLPAGYKEIVDALSSELEVIVRNCNELLDEYLTASVTSLVAIRQSPIVMRDRSLAGGGMWIFLGILGLSFVLAIVMMSLEHLFRTAKERTGAARG